MHGCDLHFTREILTMDALTQRLEGCLLSSAPIAALQQFLDGALVDDFIHDLHAVLEGKTEKNFSQFSHTDMQATLLLLLSRFARTNLPEDLTLLFHALPYYVSRLWAYEGDLVARVATEELMRSPDVIHGLDVRIQDFIGERESPPQTREKEWANICALIVKIAPDPRFEVLPMLARSLHGWKNCTQPLVDNLAFALGKFSELSCALQPKHVTNISTTSLPRENFRILQYFARLEDDAEYKARTFAALLDADPTHPIHTPTCVLWTDVLRDYELKVLLEMVNSPSMPLGQRRGLVQLCSNSGKTLQSLILASRIRCCDDVDEFSHFAHLVRMIPQCCTSPAAWQSVKETVQSLGDESVGDTMASDPVAFLAKALIDWKVTAQPTPKQMVLPLEIFAELAYKWLDESETLRDITYDLLKRVAEDHEQRVGVDCTYIQKVIYQLYKKTLQNPDELIGTTPAWTEQLDGPELELIFYVANSKSFNHRIRNTLFNYYLREDRPARSLSLAVRLAPSLDFKQSVQLVTKLQERKESPAVSLFADTVGAMSYPEELRNRLVGHLQNQNEAFSLLLAARISKSLYLSTVLCML